MPDPSSWHLERIARRHVRDRFDSGEPDLDAYLHRFARQNDEREISRTWVAVRPGEDEVLGFVTLRTGRISRDDLPVRERGGLPRYPVPVVYIARLAVHCEAQGLGLGTWLLVRALESAVRVADGVAVFAVEVVAKSDAARTFYERFGFKSLEDDRRHLYLSIRAIRRALE